MASTRKKTTKSGKTFYEMRYDLGRGKSELTRRWYPPEGWSQKAIDRELSKQAAEFERQCKAGEVLTRKEQQAQARQAALEAEKVLTLRQYGEQAFMPSIAVKCSENTRSTYQGYLDHRIYPALGAYKMREITSAQITALLLSMQEEGLTNSTCVKVYTILHSLFKMAYMGDMIERNQMDKVERPKPRKDEIRKDGVEAFTASELRYVLDCLDKEPLKWRALVWGLASG